MPNDTQILGHCPDCEENISTAWTLVEYEKEDGTEAVWAGVQHAKTLSHRNDGLKHVSRQVAIARDE